MHSVPLSLDVFGALRLKLRYGALSLFECYFVAIHRRSKTENKNADVNVWTSREKSQNNTKYLHQHTRWKFSFFFFFILVLVSLVLWARTKFKMVLKVVNFFSMFSFYRCYFPCSRRLLILLLFWPWRHFVVGLSLFLGHIGNARWMSRHGWREGARAIHYAEMKTERMKWIQATIQWKRKESSSSPWKRKESPKRRPRVELRARDQGNASWYRINKPRKNL